MPVRSELVDDHGFTARYASARRFEAHRRAGTPVEARVVISTVAGADAHQRHTRRSDRGEPPCPSTLG